MPNIHLTPEWQGRERDVTSEGAYARRREVIKAMGLGAVGIAGGALLGQHALRTLEGEEVELPPAGNEKWYDGLEIPRNDQFEVPERELTERKIATTYNNFYEFSTDKDEVHRLVGDFTVSPWEIEIAGEVKNPGKLDVEKLIKDIGVEERIYRFRCVEAWAMTVPWSGIPMRQLIERVEPKSTARYARFLTFLRPDQAPGQLRYSHYDWPYYEGFDMEELTNELTMLATGIYGKPMPRQNGAPIRVITPWKYGLKCIKSIVKIEFTRERPSTFWNDAVPDEYSYYSNVEPDVPHPRWSQATERLIGSGERVPTKLWNGYGEWVANLYDKKEGVLSTKATKKAR